jgi:DNA (cytosine-5)-methyltransferase 1
MENVKGMLSAKVDGVGMIERIMDDLRSAGGKPDNYHILPLVADTRGKMSGHIVRAEDFGIPQARHRVILLGIRTDVFNQCGLQDGEVPALAARPVRATVRNVLEGMPRLRSGLSRTVDTPDGWRTAVMGAFRDAATACEAHTTDLGEVARKLRHHAGKMLQTDEIPPRVSTNPAPIQDNRLAAWLVDPRVGVLPNHESRGHMEADLARYAFAATFAEVFDRSPKADEFPGPCPRSPQLGERQICRPVQGSNLGFSLHDRDQPHLKGWSLLHPSRPVAMPEPDGARGCPVADFP